MVYNHNLQSKMNQDSIQKNYYEQLMVGHYIDVKYSEHEWKIGKIIEKDKRYAVVTLEGINYKDQVSKSTLVDIESHPFARIPKATPVPSIVPIDHKHLPFPSTKTQHLQILQTVYLQQSLPTAFTTTQYIRGQMFVLVHSLLTKEDLKEQQYSEAMAFMVSFVDFAVKYANKIIKLLPEYFQNVGGNKLAYLVNDRVAYVSAFSQILILLNLLLKAQASKHLSIFKSKQLSQQTIIKHFIDMKVEDIFSALFKANDKNGKWLPFSVHKHLYHLLKKYHQKWTLPSYKLRDYQEVFMLYPYIIGLEEKNNTIEESYVGYVLTCIKEQTAFEAKMKAIQELKKITEGEVKLYKVEEKYIYNLINSQCIIDHLLNEYSFNPEIFKRFIPVLEKYCKSKSLNIKTINSLFKLATNRHESQVNVIFDIICLLAEFVQIDALDTMYQQILKYNINQEQTIQLVKNFTINAIVNYSQQSSFLSVLFRRRKNSSKYGYYGLDLFFKEIQDDGSILPVNIPMIFDNVKEIFTVEIFQGERINYLTVCLGWLEKIKNYGQSIKLIDTILLTFPISSFFGETRKDLLDKLLLKNNLLHLTIFGLKHKQKISQKKIPLAMTIKYLYDFLENYYDIFIPHIKIDHIQFLWSLNQPKLLSSFLKKSKNSEPKKKQYRQKYMKKIDESVQDDILNRLIKKPSFYERELTIQQFQALDQIFMSFNLIKKKLDISDMGMIRYLTPQMEGYHFYFQYLGRMTEQVHVDRIIKKIINIFLRPKDEKQIQTKATTWKMCLLKLVDKLKNKPETCLKAISLFFEMIQGKLFKPNVSFTTNIDVTVNLENQQKVIILPRNNTIFRLRKQIMNDFNISGDFSLYSVYMKRQITFMEEEEYSLNALTNSTTDKPILNVVNRKKDKHPQVQAIEKFKQIIEKQQSFYTLLFSLNDQKIHEVFWKTVEMLPVNKQLIKRIQNCANLSKKQWHKMLKSQTNESLQYHLNIIYELMEKNKKWVSLFFASGGMDIIVELLSEQMKDEQLVKERISNKCILILIYIMEVVNKIEEDVLEQLKLTLIAKIINLFKHDLSTITTPISSLNNIFHLLKEINKSLKKKTLQIQLEIMLKILEYGMFQEKKKVTVEFIQQDFEHYLINNYGKEEEKVIIYEHLLSFLKVDILKQKEYSELFYTFLIDYMNTFVEQEHTIIEKEQYLNIIQTFVMAVLTNPHEDSSKHKRNHLIYGAFKLLIYTLNYPNHQYDLEHLFKILVKDFFFNKEQKRIKHESTTKLLYEATKKILFTDQKLIEILVDNVVPQLRQNSWRKNTYSSWMLQNKRQERNIFCGLENLGATCYINCLTQQLFMIPHFRQHFMSIDSTSYREKPENNEILQYQRIFAGLKHSSNRSVTSRKFCQSFITYQGLPINPMIQSDADEFFNQLMEKIESFLKENKRHDIIENTFEGMLSNQLNCEGCPHKSEKEDHFLSMGVNIRGKKTLEEALEGFVEGEILDGDNAYFCEICQKKVRTQKRLCVKSLPNILTITIKRFEFDYDEMRKIKINSYLKFPQKLNMKPYTAEHLAGTPDLPDQPYKYNLRGAVIHSGTSEGGHYYSFIQSKNQWYCFNDEFIEESKYSRIEEDGFGGQDKSLEGDFKFQKYKNAYILFYEKQHTSEEYHREQSITSAFSQKMEKDIMTDNSSADFLSVMLDSNFIRLSQNFSILENDQAYKFSFLYFHTVVLRDRNKEEHIPNYYRILDNLLNRKEVSEWYLKEINNNFMKEFLIESSRTVRFVATSLVLKAIGVVDSVPDNFIMHAISCLRKSAMTPFAKIFTLLAKKPEHLQKLMEYEYTERVIGMLMERSNQNFKMLDLTAFQSYFGSDCSEKQKQGQVCQASLCESLGQFDLQFGQALQIFEKYSSRAGSKALAQLMARKIAEDQMSSLLISMQSNLLKEGDIKKEELEKYLFFVRYNILNEGEGEWRVDKSIYSLKKIVYECRLTYEPMETLLRQLNYIASRNKNFMNKWKSSLQEKEKLYDLIKGLKFWLKQAEHPQYMSKSDEFKRKIASLPYEQKHEVQSKNHSTLQKRLHWMIEPQLNTPENYDSDIEAEGANRQVLIRNKKVRIKEHLGLIKKVEFEGNERWGILQRNELDLYHSL